MACVLTVALIEDDVATVASRDTRLYLLRAGEITKITHDHSPVGEREDHGEISEAEPCAPRRNEIFRDVAPPRGPRRSPGSSKQKPSDATRRAVLLCSDGSPIR